MAIHDVSKDDNARLDPKANASDARAQRDAHNTIGTAYQKDTNANKQRIAFKNNLILYYDDMGRVIRVDGFIPGLAVYPVTIIAKYGYDVYTDILGLTAPTV